MAQPTKLRAALEGIPGAEDLAELALDMRWSWSHASDKLWGRIDPELWEITHNPWVVFQTASSAKLKQLFGEKDFRTEVNRLRAHQLRESDAVIALGAGAWVLFGILRGKLFKKRATVFLKCALVASITGHLFPFHHFLSTHWGAMSAVIEYHARFLSGHPGRDRACL
jgi:hypothetical protein